MLTIAAVSGSREAVLYYANLGDAENHDYYSSDGQRPGVWFGTGAEALGLAGQIDPNVFQNLLNGRSPDGAKDLVQQRSGSIRHRAGFDLTFSVPKSVSVLWSQMPAHRRHQIDAVVERAVRSVLQVVQDECGVTRRGHNGHTQEPAQLIGALYRHDTARGLPGQVPDANLHLHAVLVNAVVREDGSTGALDARPLFEPRKKMALGALFRAELARGLRDELGVGVYRPSRPGHDRPVTWFEIEGVPELLLQAMSKRRSEIEAWLREHGLSEAKAAERANRATRTKKQLFTWYQLTEAWAKLARQHDWGPVHAESLLKPTPTAYREASLEELATRALDLLMQGRARFTRNELLEVMAVEAQTTGIGADRVLQAVEGVFSRSAEIVPLQKKRGLATYTTRQMLDLEAGLIARASRLHDRSGRAVRLADVARVLRRHPTLRPEQREAVRAVVTGPDCVAIVGVAGSGKTYMLGVAREAFEEAGYRLIGTALAADAAQEIQKGSGIASVHLHKLLYRLKQGQATLDSNTVVVVDEAGMVGTRQMADLLRRVEDSGSKLVLVGDPRQLQPVDAGAPFRMIGETIGSTTLSDIVRQHESYARQVVRDLRDGDAEAALQALDRRGQVVIATSEQAARERLVVDWRRLVFEEGFEPGQVAVLTGQNEAVRDLNRRLHEVMRSAGRLGDYTVELDSGPVSLGDRVVVTKNQRLLGLRNGQRGEVVGASDRTLWVRLEDGFEVEVDTDYFPHITLGYASSIHRSQGKTAEHALYLAGDSMTSLELGYVAGSRARGQTLVYASAVAVESIEGLAARMNVSRPQEMACEHLPEVTR